MHYTNCTNYNACSNNFDKVIYIRGNDHTTHYLRESVT